MFIVLFSVYLAYFIISMLVLKLVLKVDKNWFAHGKAQANLPKWYKYTFWAITIVLIIAMLMRRISFIGPITILLLNDTFINYKAIKYINSKEEQYYPYRTIIGNIMLIIIVWIGLFI